MPIVTHLTFIACLALAGAAGAFVATWFRPLPPTSDASTNAIRKAVTNALLRGYQSQLLAGWEQRHAYVGARLGLAQDYLDGEMRLLDASLLAELVGRGYEGNARHMHTLGWLAHSISYDVRHYQA